MGSVLELWHDTRTLALGDPSAASLPDPAELEEAALHTDINDLMVNQDDMTVFIRDPRLQLDLGAIAKGYATELVTRELLAAGWSTFVISSGGNVRTAEAPPLEDRPYWRIGIQDPLKALQGDDEALVYTVRVNNQSVVTSGDYQRYYTYEGKRYHHIIDPGTLMPADEFSSVTVVTPDSGMADFYSTEFFILPYEKGREYADSLDNVEVMWIFKDGKIEMTDGMKMIADKPE
jgi:thiamine biosynthesis lipoprotein